MASSGDVKVYNWGEAPNDLKTRKQLALDGLRPNRRAKPVARIEWKRGKKWADLFSVADTVKKQPPSPAMLNAIAQREAKAKLCRFCGADYGYRLPRRWSPEDCTFCCMAEGASQAEAILASNPLFLDFETHTLGGYAVELAIVDIAGNVLFEQRINPLVPIEEDATCVHGITDDDVKNAPPFAHYHEQLRALLKGRVVVAYNARFDRGVLRAELARMGVTQIKLKWECAMELLMTYRGSKYPEKLGGNHSARGDCLRTLELVRAIADKSA